MDRTLLPTVAADHGKALMSGEPLIFHCNYYNYFLQKTLLLDESLGMQEVIRAAAASVAREVLRPTAGESPRDVLEVAQSTFSQLGFGTIDLSKLTGDGGSVEVPVSHYGVCLRSASGADFAQPQSWFDAGFAIGACEVAYGREPGGLDAELLACQSMGAPRGRIRVGPGRLTAYDSPGQGFHATDATIPPPFASRDPSSRVDEAAILGALATLDLSGNEEGLIPRFGVMLTNHMANFYNRISFEFLERMGGSGMLEAAEMLLTEAGHRCAFHTFGGIMQSAEWDAVVKPSCEQWQDWVHGIVAVVNALGWGVWRVHELDDKRLVVRIYDDYESCGYLGMYGRSENDVSWLAQGGVAGIMGLVRTGDIQSRPELDYDFYRSVFESEQSFEARQTRSLAKGDDYTEIIAERT